MLLINLVLWLLTDYMVSSIHFRVRNARDHITFRLQLIQNFLIYLPIYPWKGRNFCGPYARSHLRCTYLPQVAIMVKNVTSIVELGIHTCGHTLNSTFTDWLMCAVRLADQNERDAVHPGWCFQSMHQYSPGGSIAPVAVIRIASSFRRFCLVDRNAGVIYIYLLVVHRAVNLDIRTCPCACSWLYAHTTGLVGLGTLTVCKSNLKKQQTTPYNCFVTLFSVDISNIKLRLSNRSLDSDRTPDA